MINRELHITVKVSLEGIARRTPVSGNIRTDIVRRGCCRPPLVGIVGFTYGSYPRGEMVVARNYRKYLRRPYIRIYPGGTIRVRNNESRVSRSTYVGYKGYLRTYPCGTVVGRRHPYSGTYNVGTVNSSRCKETRVSRSGYMSYKRYLMDYPFDTVMSGKRVFRAVVTLGDRAPICTVITPTVTNRFPNVRGGGVQKTFRTLNFASMERITINTSLYAIRRTGSFLRRIPRGLPFVTASYYPS